MRSMTRMPAFWKMFPGYLREAGYYCTNNSQGRLQPEKPEGTWDDSSRRRRTGGIAGRAAVLRGLQRR